MIAEKRDLSEFNRTAPEVLVNLINLSRLPCCFYCKMYGYLVQVDPEVEGELPIMVCRPCLEVGIADGRIEEYQEKRVRVIAESA